MKETSDSGSGGLNKKEKMMTMGKKKLHSVFINSLKEQNFIVTHKILN